LFVKAILNQSGIEGYGLVLVILQNLSKLKGI